MLLRMSAFVDDNNDEDSNGDSHDSKNKRALNKHFLWTRHCSQGFINNLINSYGFPDGATGKKNLPAM